MEIKLMDAITVSVEEVLNAIEKNGYEQVKGTWVGVENGKLVGCAIGQGAINLGVSYQELTSELDTVTQKRKDLSTMGSMIMYLNDRRGKKIPEIVQTIKEKFAHQLDKRITVNKIDYYKLYADQLKGEE